MISALFATQPINIYWSKQHGAICTLLLSFFTTMMLSQHWHLSQLAALTLTLSSFHCAEIISLKKYHRQKLAFYSYLCLALLCLFFTPHNQMFFISSVFIATLLITYQKVQGKHRLLEHFIAFQMLIFSSLLAYHGDHWQKTIMTLGLVSCYFYLTILGVHFRLKKIPLSTVLSFGLIASLVALPFTYFSVLFSWMILVLISKTCVLYILKNQWQNIPLKKIGFLELLSSIVFIATLTLLYWQ